MPMFFLLLLLLLLCTGGLNDLYEAFVTVGRQEKIKQKKQKHLSDSAVLNKESTGEKNEKMEVLFICFFFFSVVL